MLKDRPIFGCASLATIKEGSYLQSNDADSVVKLVDANEGRTPIKLSEILSGARLILQSSFQPLSRDHAWRILSLLGFPRICKHHENISECTGVKEFFNYSNRGYDLSIEESNETKRKLSVCSANVWNSSTGEVVTWLQWLQKKKKWKGICN